MHVAQNIPVSESKKVVSIVFADIIGSTEALSITNSQTARTYIQAHIDTMSSSVQKYGGEMIKTQGDGIIALFGHSAGAEDHALRAAYASITMIRECRKIGEPHPQIKYKGLRIGLHSGYALISQFGSASDAKTDTFGLTTHIASKLQTAAPVDHICLSETTQALLTRFIPPKLYKLVPIGEGVDPISSYVIDAFNAVTANAPFKIGAAKNEIIGRASEISDIDAIVDFSKSDLVKTLIILGEAGIGKTRIIDEISNRLTSKAVTQIVLSGVDVMKDTPFFVIRQILLTIDLEVLSFLEGEEREALEVLQSMDPLRMQKWRVAEYQKVAAIYSGYIKILEHLNRLNPVTLIAEDMHFFDEESLNFIVKLLSRLNPSHKIALIGTSRLPLPFALKDRFASSIHLKPLNAHHSNKLAHAVASQFPGETDATTIQSIVSSSRGSPLALTEFTKLQFSQNQNLDEHIPLFIEPVMRSRVERLSPEGRLLTDFLCLLGHEANIDTLKELSGRALEEINTVIEECISRGILKKTSSGHYNFSHDLYRITCLNGLSATDKIKLHKKIYNYLTSSTASHTSVPDIQLMARQAFGAGYKDEALIHFKSAFALANGLGAIRTVRNLFNQVNQFCNQMEEGKFHKARFAMLSFDATHRLAEEQSLLQTYTEALEAYPHKFSPNERIVIQSHLAIIYWTNGESSKGLAFASDAMRAVEKTHHLGLECIAVYTQACLEYSLGYLETAVNRIRQQVKKMPRELSKKKWGQSVSIPSVVLQTFGAWFAADAGDFELADAFLKEATKTSDQYPNTYGFVLGQLGQGYVLYRKKQFAEGSEILLSAYEIASVSSLSLAPMSAAWAALCLIEVGQVDKAQTLLTQEFSSGRQDIMRNANRVYLFLAKANLNAALGDYKAAEDWISRAVLASRSNGDLITLAYCYADYAKILTLQNTPNADRIRYLKNAIDIAAQCGMQPLKAECQAQLDSQSLTTSLSPIKTGKTKL